MHYLIKNLLKIELKITIENLAFTLIISLGWQCHLPNVDD